MQLTIHTERGTFTSKKSETSEAEASQIQDLIQQSVSEGAYFTLVTETGYVVIGAGLLRTAAFVVTPDA